MKFQNPEKRDACIEKKEAALVLTFRRSCRVSIRFSFSWAGTFGVTKTPCHVGSPDFPNSYFMLGFGETDYVCVMGMDIISDLLEKAE
jgi:hypothetical protein